MTTFKDYMKEHEAFKWALNFIAETRIPDDDTDGAAELKFVVEIARKALAGELTLDE